MTVRRVPIYTPIFVMLFLLQSYFWMTTYEEQSKGNPDRLYEYITPYTGDVHTLNTFLSADPTRSHTESMVFENLLARDKDLNFRIPSLNRGRFMSRSFFYINDALIIPEMDIPGQIEVS